MKVTNHLLIDDEVRKLIDDNRKYARETNNDVLRRLLKLKNSDEKLKEKKK